MAKPPNGSRRMEPVPPPVSLYEELVVELRGAAAPRTFHRVSYQVQNLPHGAILLIQETGGNQCLDVFNMADVVSIHLEPARVQVAR